MPKYQLPIAIALVVWVVFSALLLWIQKSHEGNIKLPLHTDGEGGGIYEQDPFDVTTPVDVMDGEPINEQAFWARVRSVIVKPVLLLRI